MKKKIIIGVILVALVAGVGFWRFNASKGKTGGTVQTFALKKGTLLDSTLVSGTVVSSNSRNVYSNAANYSVMKVNYKVGDKVKAGDVLAVLDTKTLDLDIKQTELNLKNAEETLKNAQNTNSFNVQTASNNVESSSLELKNAQDSYDKVKKLYDAGTSSQDELTKAEGALKKAQLAYDNAKASLNNAQSKGTTEAKNNIEIQKANLEKQKQTLNNAKIIAPIDGTVTMVNAKEGGAATGVLFVVEDTDNLVISTEIGEYDIKSIKVGQDVAIKSDGTGDKELAGTVSKIAPTATKDVSGNTTASSDVKFDTEVALKDKDPNIKIGMNVRLTIKISEKKDVYSLPYDAIVTESDGSEWIYVVDKTQKSGKSQDAAKKIKVQKGLETDMYVEVSSPDLTDGMDVEINPKTSTKTSK